jgi:succinate-acetate transporter protein
MREVFIFLLYLTSRPLNRDALKSGEVAVMDFSTYGNAMWNVIITMTTVGYGDFYARTEIGRFVIFIVCIWGVFVVSLMVVTMTNILTMSGGEERVIDFLSP